ncbi:MAG: ABC transporter permease subunit [Actinobacteria bacterium]|nr:ABC transporter permease subunit [Actinomycetota bacterium]
MVAVALVGSLVHSGVGRDATLNPAGWPQLRRFLAAALDPARSAEFLRLAWDATLTTLAYAVLGTVVALVIGVVGGVAISETWWRRRPGGGRGTDRLGGLGGWLASRLVVGLPRGVHEAVWALFLVSVLGLDPLVGVLAIGIPYGAVTAKIYAELLDEAPRGAFDALRTAGVGRLRALAYTLAPLAFPDLLSYAFYRFECAIRGAAILGIIGAGGLGFQLALSFQSLRYDEMWTLIYALVAVCGLADWWSTTLRRRSALPGRTIAGLGDADDGSEPATVAIRSSMRRDRRLHASAVATVALVVVSVWHLGIDVATLWAPRTQRLASDLAISSWPPDLGAADLSRLATLSLQTLEMSVVATILASAAGMAMAFVVSGDRQRSTPGAAQPARRVVPAVGRAVLLICRAVPPPVGALLALFVLFPGPLPGALALAVYNTGILGRLMAEVVENLEPGPSRALRSQGASAGQAFVYATLPRTLPRFAAFGLYRWEVTIRETVVVGLVGAGGLGRLLGQQLASFDYRGVTATLITLVALSFAVDLISSRVRRALR